MHGLTMFGTADRPLAGLQTDELIDTDSSYAVLASMHWDRTPISEFKRCAICGHRLSASNPDDICRHGHVNDSKKIEPKPSKKCEKFDGTPCNACGETLRYVNGGACVACSTTRRWKKKEDIPKHPCRWCGKKISLRYEHCRECGLIARPRIAAWEKKGLCGPPWPYGPLTTTGKMPSHFKSVDKLG